jgi:hypothetical protein
MNTIAASVLEDAIATLRRERMDVYTFALYFDHESCAISVCADTVANSLVTIEQINRYNRKYFDLAVTSGDLQAASMWCANTGRSLALGDFALKNLARSTVDRSEVTEDFYRGILRALLDVEDKVATLTTNKASLLLCCSGPSDEVEFFWTPRVDAETT